jgi:glycosyltransferase involved in cell wall biosynthesis
MLHHLLSRFAAGSYLVLTDSHEAFAGLSSDGWLPAPHYFHGSPRRFSAAEAADVARDLATTRQHNGTNTGGVGQFLRRVSAATLVQRKVRQVTEQAIRVIEQENCEIVLAPSSDPVFMVAAARAARVTGKPLYVHLFDLLAGNRYFLPRRLLASSEEPGVLRGAAKIFVPNEAMAAHYRDLLGVSTIIVSNGTEIPVRPPSHPVSAAPTVLYTGALYWAQRDPLRSLAAALRDLPKVNLEVRTSATPHDIKRSGLDPQKVSGAFSTRGDALQAQRSADILYLPLSFAVASRPVVRTALPAKTAEYMVSGTPILVHAPGDAYLSKYARSVGWGHVVDSPSSTALADAIRRLLADHPLRESLVDGAYEEACSALDLRKIIPAYVEHFE